MVQTISSSLIEETLEKARASPRKRVIHCFHRPEDYLQRMLNATLEGTYVQPHQHENKLEIFSILKGKVAILTFDDQGNILTKTILDEKGQTKIIEIPPKTWHSFLVLSSEAVLFEIIEGFYCPKTHKIFAPWAPAEGSNDSEEYLKAIKNKVIN